VGGFLQAAVEYPALRRMGFRLRPHLRGHPALRRLLAFLGPALIGVATIQVGVLVDVQIAATYGDGPVSWLGYAFRLVQLPMSIFAGAVAVASLAALSAQVARGEREEARGTLGDAVALTSFLVLPSAVALGVFAHPLVELFYQRGAFSAADTAATASLLQLYALGTFAFCLHRVVVPSFYAWGDPWTPMVLSIGTVVAKVPLALWLAGEGMLAVRGIPLAHALVATAEVVVLVVLLGRRAGGWSRGLGVEHLRLATAAALMGLGGWWALARVDGLALELLVGVASGAVYLGATWALGSDQPRALARRVRRRLAPPPGGPR
jgi:putative peptidoglycan lipid II flippase